MSNLIRIPCDDGDVEIATKVIEDLDNRGIRFDAVYDTDSRGVATFFIYLGGEPK